MPDEAGRLAVRVELKKLGPSIAPLEGQLALRHKAPPSRFSIITASLSSLQSIKGTTYSANTDFSVIALPEQPAYFSMTKRKWMALASEGAF